LRQPDENHQKMYERFLTLPDFPIVFRKSLLLLGVGKSCRRLVLRVTKKLQKKRGLKHKFTGRD
jgi:hypothetical protein